MYYVYLLEDQVERSWYIGFTKNLKARFDQHRYGNVRTTRLKKHLKLIYFEGYRNTYDALGRERFLKSGSGRRFLKKQLRHYLETRNQAYFYQ